MTRLTLICLAAILTAAPVARALDDAHWAKADAAIEDGIAYLRSTQNEDGSWSPAPGPAITAMALSVMLNRKDISTEDPAVKKAVAYILSHANEDGSIHAGILANYNTSTCVSALVLVPNDPEVARAIAAAEDYLKGLQWRVGMTTPDGQEITEDHPYFGGVGYGKHGRPDGSNLNYMLQALHDAGVDCNDPTYQNALAYIHRLQGIESNDMFADQIVNDGGFIYATSINKDLIGVPESKASQDQIDEAKHGNTNVSGLRTYGSMTYAMFKSMLYANLDRDDPRVVAVRGWIADNWTLDQNPGMPVNEETKTHLQGLYYYYMALARGMDAWGSSSIELSDGASVDWANELIDALVTRQREDGSWANQSERWYEGDPNLATCYALIALQHATD